MTSFDLEAGLPERTFFAFGAGRVAFRDTGLRSDCPPLLLVHGLGSSSLTWTRLVARLPSDRRIILVDLPGFGKSDAVDPVSLGGFGDAIVALLTQLEVERAVWIGHSMGGQVSILQALAQPALFERLFLIAPAGLERFSSQEGRLLRAAVTTSGIKRQRRKDVAANVRLAFDRWVPEAEALVDARMAIVGEELDRYAATFKASSIACTD
ncbi:MAG: alpha/beta fold hydrolase, partial [Myxococcota bacterium]